MSAPAKGSAAASLEVRACRHETAEALHQIAVAEKSCDGDHAHLCDISLMPETAGLSDGRIMAVIDRYAKGECDHAGYESRADFSRLTIFGTCLVNRWHVRHKSARNQL